MFVVISVACAPLTTTSEFPPTVRYSGVEFQRQLIATRGYRHVVFTKEPRAVASARPVWVFIDGDGAAWMRDGRIAEDPTPVAPIALELLAEWPSAGVYIGRPCTFGMLDLDARCDPRVWVIDRYSDAVVDSMHAALQALDLQERSTVLVGYSGGGVLAMRLAARLDAVVGILTIAANLDVARWVEHHGYSAQIAEQTAPLVDSTGISPVSLHVFGAHDVNAPLELARDYLADLPRAHVRVFSEADHACCWRALWPVIVAEFQQLMDAADRNAASSSAR